MFRQTWADGYRLMESVHDFSKDLDLQWPTIVMTQWDVPATARHMDIMESYPSTADALDGNYS